MSFTNEFSKKETIQFIRGLSRNIIKLDGKSVIEHDGSRVAGTPIQEFYKNQNIFITGGTGYLGKVLIEKLLRCCPEISKVFVLVREKKGRTVTERIQDFLKDSIFDYNRSNMENFEEKICGIGGDCREKNLGIAENDIELLIKEVSIIFHVAANVRFSEKINEAFSINIQSTSTIVDLCKNMKNLKSFMHVSTIYANCFASDIEEKFYNYSINYKELEILVNTLPEEFIEAITPQLIKSWPNTYTFTKAIAEDFLRKACTNLPVAIFRPSIVTPTAYEPTPGWIDNYNHFGGIAASVASGTMRVLHCNPNELANFVPVDLTVNALIASAWATNTQTNRRGENMLIYNFTSANDAPIVWAEVRKNLVRSINEYPPTIALWCGIIRLTKYKFVYDLYTLFLHLIPAYTIDFIIRTTGQKPRLLATYKKIHTMASIMSYFLTNTWQFKDKNVDDLWNRLDARDQQIFKFSMLNFDWKSYIFNCMKGIRVFLFKDDLETLEKSRARNKRFLMAHQFMVALLVGLICWILYKAILTLLL